MKVTKKYRCGFVAGMFDIFHRGHLDILQFSKEKCEYLIVAVGTDEFYRIRKKREPLMPFIDRRDIVASIRYVDKVVPAMDLDKIAMYEKYKFDVMFVGEDHLYENVYTEATDKLKKLGVDVIYMERRGITSTLLREYICDDLKKI